MKMYVNYISTKIFFKELYNTTYKSVLANQSVSQSYQASIANNQFTENSENRKYLNTMRFQPAKSRINNPIL